MRRRRREAPTGGETLDLFGSAESARPAPEPEAKAPPTPERRPRPPSGPPLIIKDADWIEYIAACLRDRAEECADAWRSYCIEHSAHEPSAAGGRREMMEGAAVSLRFLWHGCPTPCGASTCVDQEGYPVCRRRDQKEALKLASECIGRYDLARLRPRRPGLRRAA